MSFLLDTHAVIWFITDDPKLPADIKQLIETANSTVFVSIASFWELGIKHSLNKLALRQGLSEIFDVIRASGIAVLPITPEHILANVTLPFHHRDPFERLLVAQVVVENLVLVTKDEWIKQYDVKARW